MAPSTKPPPNRYLGWQMTLLILATLALLAGMLWVEIALHERTSLVLGVEISLAIIVIWLAVIFSIAYRSFYRLLGAPIHQVHERIEQLAHGEFNQPIVLQPGDDDSILASIKSTQERLQQQMADNQRLKQLYSALSQCNQAIVRCQSEAELFPLICEDAVRFGGMKMAWIGINDPIKHELIIVSYAGTGSDYLNDLHISTDPNNPLAHGPTGTAFLTGQPFWCQDFQNDPATALWHERGQRFDWHASAAIPLYRQGVVTGIFTLYSSELNAFDEPAQALLNEMALDISYALDSFDRAKAHELAEQKIRRLVHYDELTSLPNRAYLNEHGPQLILTAEQQATQLAILSLDIDHFKDINDSLGHSIGDQLLIEVAHRMQSALHTSELLARIGGDDFIIMLPNSDQNTAIARATQFIEQLRQTYHIGAHQLNISGSVGISVYPQDGQNFETLYKNADSAMYHAKEQGRNTYSCFDSEMQTKLLRTIELSNALHHAIHKQQFALYYQPQFCADNEMIIGAEALLRWQHPNLGFISPAEFIPIAEANGTIIDIGDWVLRTAITQAKAWFARGLPPLTVAVNLSAIQFTHLNLSRRVRELLDEIELPATFLELELTEGAAMIDPVKTITTLNELNQLGVHISIDDFGTGYSSLSYLKKFSIDKLKIDQSFVRDIMYDADDRAIVTTIINMAKNLHIQTIAEGVETKEQLDYLAANGCNAFQGYYYSKPLTAADFERFVQQHQTQQTPTPPC